MLIFAVGWSPRGVRAMAARFPVVRWWEPGTATLADVIRAQTGGDADVVDGPAPTDACAPPWCGPWAGSVRCDGTCRSRPEGLVSTGVRDDGAHPDRRVG